jgi:hypothetical protein
MENNSNENNRLTSAKSIQLLADRGQKSKVEIKSDRSDKIEKTETLAASDYKVNILNVTGIDWTSVELISQDTSNDLWFQIIENIPNNRSASFKLIPKCNRVVSYAFLLSFVDGGTAEVPGNGQGYLPNGDCIDNLRIGVP